MVPRVVKDPSPSNATGTGTRRNRVFAIAEDNSGGDLADRNTRERDRIARVEVALSLCMVADRRRHERECGPCSENRCLSGARTKHRLRSVPWYLRKMLIQSL